MAFFFLAVAVGCVMAATITAWAIIKGLRTTPTAKWEPGTLKEWG